MTGGGSGGRVVALVPLELLDVLPLMETANGLGANKKGLTTHRKPLIY